MKNIKIRYAQIKDAKRMLNIYSQYVKNTTVSSEYKPPDIKEFCKRIENYMQKTPWLVCEIDDKIVGYCYASMFKIRSAYQWSVETSIYVSQDFHRFGIATALYTAIFEILYIQGYYNIYVSITSSNKKSIKFHKSMGFNVSGVYKNCMYKFGKWHDVIYMNKTLRKHDKSPRPTIKLKDVKINAACDRILVLAADKVNFMENKD